VPELALTAARGIVLVVAVLVVWRLRHVADPVVRVGTSYLVLLTAMYLASLLSETYYSMTLLPALLLVARRAGSPLRNPLAWIAVYGFFAFDLMDAAPGAQPVDGPGVLPHRDRLVIAACRDRGVDAAPRAARANPTRSVTDGSRRGSVTHGYRAGGRWRHRCAEGDPLISCD